MTPARLQTVEEIFHAALDQKSDRVGAFLDAACEGDEVLRRKVEALVASHQRAGSFIETTVAGITTRIIENEQADLLVGQTIGHYKISKRIGTGGMGDVYLATDITAGRKAALKLLPTRFTSDAQRLKRFQQEARTVVGLNHPNILTVYEIGEYHSTHYIASELIEGETLRQRLMRGRMELREAVDVAIQVASALAVAHETGIVHRDIKPENIMLRPDGYVKVLDFGIAKLAESAFAEAAADRAGSMTLAETNLGSISGTVRYMSPEQARGAQIDKRTDIWSLGVVLYEMVAEHAPFTGDTSKEVMSSILEKEPPPLTSYNKQTPPELQQITSKTLRKDREERYHTAHELLEALKGLRHKLEFKAELRRSTSARSWLRWTAMTAALLALAAIVATLMMFSSNRVRSTPAAPEKSIAVLPFENLSHDPDNAYFADGIQEEILTRLASVADLKIISRTSTQRYQSKPRNLREIAKQLGVANVLEGSVQKAADQVRVNVQLVNAQTDSHLWAETYDRNLTDIFGVESEIAKGIAESLQAKLTGREEQALAAKPTNNPEAYDAYLRGLSFDTRDRPWLNKDLAEKTAGFYEQAVQLDPNFAIAWARLSRTDSYLYFNRKDAASASRGTAAKRALDNAEKLASNSPETLLALGYYQYRVLLDYGLAKTTFSRVSKMLPSSSEVSLALALITQREGHWDESVAHFEQALALDPRNVQLLTAAAWNYAMLRQFPAALKLYDRGLDLVPNDLDIMAGKACVYQAQGDLGQAAKFLSDINPETPVLGPFTVKVIQLRLERNYAEAIRLLQARQAQFHFDSELDKGVTQIRLALMQRLAGDMAGAKVTAEQGRNILEQLYGDLPDHRWFTSSRLSEAYAVIGEKDSALKAAERAITFLPSAKDAVTGPAMMENLAFILTMLGEHSRAISTLAHLLQTPYSSGNRIPITPALLRLDPNWDPLRTDPAFQKLCEEKIDKSIAVLPFENLSRDADNGYFAEGIQEEILTRLTKIGDLKVISRTSTQRYQNKPRDLVEIAKQLGVATILEGSVQKAGDQVRVNVQLINAQTDSHLWADTYDRKLTDIFGVESDIAKRIAESLQAKLTGHEEQALAVKPTNNPEAYDAYLRGLSFEARDVYSEAIGFYEQAVQLDPNFVLAWARLSRTHAFLYFRHFDTTPGTRRDAAKSALDNAQRLEPNSPETLLALGYYQYWVLLDYGLAKTTFGRVSQMLPGSSAVPLALGAITRREGNWDQSIAYYEQALALDPRNGDLLMPATFPYIMLRQFPAALKLCDRALDITPNNPEVMALKAGIYQAEGNLREAAKLLSEINAQTSFENSFRIKMTQLRLERNHGEAIRLLQARLAQFHFDSELEKTSDQLALALTQHLAGDKAGAKVTAEQARATLEPLYKNQPDNPKLAGLLSLAKAVLGEGHSALKESERAIMLLPPSTKDRVNGPTREEGLALIQTMVGEHSRAISILTRLLQTPYGGRLYGTPVTPALLRLDPFWDPLRSDPAFQKLCEDKPR